MQCRLFLDEISAMTGKRDIKVLTEILDLSDVKVISHRLHTGIGMILLSCSRKVICYLS